MSRCANSRFIVRASIRSSIVKPTSQPSIVRIPPTLYLPYFFKISRTRSTGIASAFPDRDSTVVARSSEL
jgi:hypothetical protein